MPLYARRWQRLEAAAYAFDVQGRGMDVAPYQVEGEHYLPKSHRPRAGSIYRIGLRHWESGLVATVAGGPGTEELTNDQLPSLANSNNIVGYSNAGSLGLGYQDRSRGVPLFFWQVFARTSVLVGGYTERRPS